MCNFKIDNRTCKRKNYLKSNFCWQHQINDDSVEILDKESKIYKIFELSKNVKQSKNKDKKNKDDTKCKEKNLISSEDGNSSGISDVEEYFEIAIGKDFNKPKPKIVAKPYVKGKIDNKK